MQELNNGLVCELDQCNREEEKGLRPCEQCEHLISFELLDNIQKNIFDF